jgi:hypothetical protein
MSNVYSIQHYEENTYIFYLPFGTFLTVELNREKLDLNMI